MATAVVVGRLEDVYLVVDGAEPRRFPARSLPEPGPSGALPSGLERSIRDLPREMEVRADSASRSDRLAGTLRRPVGLASVAELRLARRRLPPLSRDEERRTILAIGAASLERTLASPEEILVSLAREEERVERAVGREARASEAFLAPAGSTLEEYAQSWSDLREAFERHRLGLVGRLREQARRVVPNLSAVVGESVAARLVAAGGGVAALARMRAPRLQLLGSRRRPSAERGPRYGVLFRAERMGDVPVDRRGAYARSLAALAAIAVRADATTHSAIAAQLVARRDRRIEQLRRQAR